MAAASRLRSTLTYASRVPSAPAGGFAPHRHSMRRPLETPAPASNNRAASSTWRALAPHVARSQSTLPSLTTRPPHNRTDSTAAPYMLIPLSEPPAMVRSGDLGPGLPPAGARLPTFRHRLSATGAAYS